LKSLFPSVALWSMVSIGLAALSCPKGGEKASSEVSEISDPYIKLREAMVEEQIVRRGVKNKLVLDALRKVPRHEYVPEKLKAEAYYDTPLPIGEGQTISQPYIVALMSELLNPTSEMKVLEIGTGSGYQAAVLAEIVKEVYTIEILRPLADSARELLQRLGYTNITVMCGDGYQGWPEHAPFDGVIVTCAPDHVPEPLLDQLAVGGRLVIPVGELYQELLVYTRTEKGIKKQRSIAVRFVPMTGEAQEK
jgi:protein-L-isoaspartate(D-aspartate) O-methyltransferase